MSYIKERLKQCKAEAKKRPCKQCGKPINTATRQAMYCSQVCNNKFNEKRRNSVTPNTKLQAKGKDGKLPLSLNDLPWRRRVRSGRVMPLYGEFCHNCGKLSQTIDPDPMKRAFCSDACVREAERHFGRVVNRNAIGHRTLISANCTPKAQKVLRDYMLAQSILYKRIQCDYCERVVNYRDVGHKPSAYDFEQPSAWVGSYRAEYMFCGPRCRTHFYGEFGGYPRPPTPINKPIVVLNPTIKKILRHVFGQDNPLQKHNQNTTPRTSKTIPWKPLRERLKLTGVGSPVYRAEQYVTLPQSLQRTHKLVLIGTRLDERTRLEPAKVTKQTRAVTWKFKPRDKS